MPSATMEHEDPYKFPDDDLLPATLTSVIEKSREIRQGDRKGETFTKWEWEFSISGGQYAGLRAWGETEDRLTNLEGNRVRAWATALRGQEFAFGESLNTDDLIGLPCMIMVGHEEYKRGDGTTGYKEPVRDVISVADAQSIEPPF